MDLAFEPLVDIRRFLYEAQGGELSHEDEEYLRMLANMEEILTFQETGEFDHIATVKGVCQIVLYGDYICMRNNAAVLSKIVAEFEKAESRSMPDVLRPKIKEIGDYFVKLKEHINKLDSLAKDLNEMINGIRQRKYKITEEERMDIKFLSIDFKTESKIAKDYYEEADRVLKMFESDVESYKKEIKNSAMIYGGLAIFIAATVVTGGVAAAAAGGAAAAAGGATVAAGGTTSAAGGATVAAGGATVAAGGATVAAGGATAAAGGATVAAGGATLAAGGATVAAEIAKATAGGATVASEIEKAAAGGGAVGFGARIACIFTGATAAFTFLALYLVWKEWSAKRNVCDKLLLILVDYSYLISESQRICF